MWRGGGRIEGWEVSVTSICPRSCFNHNPKYSHRPISASPAVFAFLILTNLIAWFHVQAHSLCVGKYMFIFMLVYVWRQQPEINIRCLCLSLFTLLWEPGSLTAFGPYQLSWAGWPVSSLSLSISSHPHPTCPRAEVPDASCCTQPFNMGAGDPRAGPHMSAAYQLGHPPPPEACSQYLKAAIVPALFTMQRVMESC